MVSLAGKTLGKYRLIEQLGRGGFASVYKAYQARLDRYVAIKVLHPHLVEGEDFLARFEREAKAVAGLRHPNIVIVHDFDVQENNYFMVMEYIEGQSLKQRLEDLNRQGRHLSLADVNRIMADITNALDYAHQQGMLHRDIKPSNVLLNNASQAFLTDFGIARILSQTQFTATGALVGTPAYMSPEQGQGLKVSPASDVYSLGIMLYEFLTGHVPYDADTPLAIIFKHIRDPLPAVHSIRPDLPAGLEKVVYKALAKDPEDRFQSPAEMMQALQAIFEQDFQAETLLSRLDSASVPPAMQAGDQDQAATEAPVQPSKPSGDAESLGASAGGAVEHEPVQAEPTPEVEPETEPETVVESRPMDLTAEPEPMDEKSTLVAEERLPESAQVATLAVDSHVEGTQVEPQQLVQPPVHKPSVAQPTKVGRFTVKTWIIAGAILVGIVGLVFLLISLFRPDTAGIPTQAALAATRTMAPTQASAPMEPQPPAEIPGLAQFEQGVNLLDENQDYMAAIEMFNQAQELGFDSPELFAYRASACYEMRNNEMGCSYPDAIRDYTRAVEIDPQNPDYWINRGEIFVQIESLDQALADFNHAIELGPDYARAYDARGTTFVIIEDWGAALRDFDTAIEIDPENSDYLISRGRVKLRIEDFQGAIADFNQALDFDSLATSAYAERALAYRMLGDWENAIRDYTTAIELDPEDFTYWVARGWSYLGIEDSDEHFEAAIADFTQALNLDSGAIGAYAGKAQAFTRQGEYSAALETLDTGIGEAPPSDRLYIEKAHILWWHLGEFEAALESLDQAIAINPENWEPYTNRAEIYAYELHNPDLAIENFNQAVAVAPRGLDAPFFARGVFYISIERWPAAIEDLSMAIRINPDGPDAYGHRGEGFRQLGDLDAARADFRRFLELTQENPQYESWRAEIEDWLARNP